MNEQPTSTDGSFLPPGIAFADDWSAPRHQRAIPGDSVPRHIRWQADSHEEILQVVVDGYVTRREVDAWRRALNNHDVDCRLRVFIDLRHSEQQPAATLEPIIQSLQDRPSECWCRRVAILAPDDDVYAAASSYGRLLRASGVAAEVFRDPMKALKWCDKPEGPETSGEIPLVARAD